MQRYFFLPSVNSGFCFSSKAHGRREVIWSRLTEAVPRSMFIGHPKWQSVRYQALDRNWLMFPLLVKEKIPYENWPLEKRPVKSQKKRSEPWSAEMTISSVLTRNANLRQCLFFPPSKQTSLHGCAARHVHSHATCVSPHITAWLFPETPLRMSSAPNWRYTNLTQGVIQLFL